LAIAVADDAGSAGLVLDDDQLAEPQRNPSDSTRATRSVEPPAANGAMSVI
jgi:hypothetical protein